MRWKPINTKADCPRDEYYEDLPQHILRGKLDDPRAGWQVIQCTAEEMLQVAKQFDYAEYLDESPSSDPAEVLVKALKTIRDESGTYRNYQAGSIAAYALAEYEQLKQ